MIKNKAIHAMIIGTCIFVNSMAGVYADTTAPDTPVSAQVELVNYNDALSEKQIEIDKSVFETNAKALAEMGITVTNTSVMGDSVEVGITPYNEKNADYLYKLLGGDSVKIVEGVQAITLDASASNEELMIQTGIATDGAAASAEKASPIAAFFNEIVEWLRTIF